MHETFLNETHPPTKWKILEIQSWTKLVKKMANFEHIFQSNLTNTPTEE